MPPRRPPEAPRRPPRGSRRPRWNCPAYPSRSGLLLRCVFRFFPQHFSVKGPVNCEREPRGGTYWESAGFRAERPRETLLLLLLPFRGVPKYPPNLPKYSKMAPGGNCKRYRGHPPTQHHTDAVAPGKGRSSVAGVSLQAVSWFACVSVPMVVARSNDFCPVSQAPGGKRKLLK